MSAERPRVVVTGMGVLTTLGDSVTALHDALSAGRRGLGPVEWPEGGDLPERLAGPLDFDPRTYLGDGNLRPLDRTGRLATAAADLALDDSGWTSERRETHEAGLVLGTMFGSVGTISRFDRRALVDGPNYAKPLEFANSVINAAAGQAAIWHDLRGVNATVSGGTVSGVQAVAYACDLIRNGHAQALLAGGVDELCFESFFGFAQAGLLYDPSPGASAPAVPFDAHRSGFTLGEGACFLMLEEAGTAQARGAETLAEVLGHGDAYDSSRGRDPERCAGALVRSLEIALADAGKTPRDIGCVSSSASGDVRGDRAEAVGLALALGDLAAELPVTAPKSALGETLGSSGALQVATLIQAMRAGVLPGVAELVEPEEGLGLRLGAESRELGRGCGLITALGLEGKGCSLVVEA